MPKLKKFQASVPSSAGKLRRRPQTVARPPLWTRLKEKGRRLFKITKIVAALILAGGLFYYIFSAEGYFRCQNLTINGLQTLEQQQVMAVLPPIKERNLLLLPLSKIQQQVATLNLVEQVVVKRIWPGELRITVRERVPLAVAVLGGKSWAVDKMGVILYPYKPAQLQEPIFITGLVGEKETLQERLRQASKLISRLRDYPASALEVSEVNVADTEVVKLYAFTKGLEIRLEDDCYQQPKWDYLINFLQRRSFAPEKLAYLDLRFKDVVVRPL